MAAMAVVGAIVLALVVGVVAEGHETPHYNMFDAAPRCKAMAPPLCAETDVFSDARERMIITDINTLRFDPHLFLKRHDLAVTDVACGLSRKEVVPLPPLRWRADLSEAAKYQARAMANSGGMCMQRDTCPGYCEPFNGNCHFRARIHKFHDCGDDDVVFQLVGAGTADEVVRTWIKDFESCTLLMSRGAVTIGAAHHEDAAGQSYWAIVSSEARTKFKNHEVVSGSHELLADQPQAARFSVLYFNPAVDDSLKEFAVVVGDEHHFLTRHLGYSYNTDLVGKSGLYQDVVMLPMVVPGKRCIPYHFRFVSLRVQTPQRLPETGEFYVTGYNDCDEVYTSTDATINLVDVQENVAEAYDPAGQVARTPQRRTQRTPPATAGTLILYGGIGAALVLFLWRARRRLLRPLAGLPLFAKPAPRMRP